MAAVAVAEKPEVKVEEATPSSHFKFRFRLMAGDHVDGKGPGYIPGKRDEEGLLVYKRNKEGTLQPVDPGVHGEERRFHWKENPVIDTDVNLAARYGSEKFKLESGGPMEAAPPRELDLEKLSVPQLLGLAEDEKIDLKGAAKKPEIIAALKALRNK